MDDAAQWIDLLDRAVDEFVDVISEAPDLAMPVPACPDWALAALVDHVRVTHLWAAHAVTEGTPDGTAPEIGRDRDALVAGYVAAAEHLLTVLREAPADAPAWTFGDDRTVAFWQRRQAHELTLHLRDALGALGRDAEWTISPELAWDGVDEAATVFYPRQVRLERTAPLAATLRLRATDVGASIDVGEGGPVVEATGSAEELLLLLWKRRTPDDADVRRLLESAAVTP